MPPSLLPLNQRKSDEFKMATLYTYCAVCTQGGIVSDGIADMFEAC